MRVLGILTSLKDEWRWSIYCQPPSSFRPKTRAIITTAFAFKLAQSSIDNLSLMDWCPTSVDFMTWSSLPKPILSIFLTSCYLLPSVSPPASSFPQLPFSPFSLFLSSSLPLTTFPSSATALCTSIHFTGDLLVHTLRIHCNFCSHCIELAIHLHQSQDLTVKSSHPSQHIIICLLLPHSLLYTVAFSTT